MLVDRVADDEVLYRRVPALREYFKVEGETTRISSQAFSDRQFRPSVDRAALLNDDPSRTQQDPTDAVVRLVAGEVRAIASVEQRNEKGETTLRHVIDVEPVPLPQNPAHAEIFAIPDFASKGVFRKLQESLARLAPWEIPPGQLTNAGSGI